MTTTRTAKINRSNRETTETSRRAQISQLRRRSGITSRAKARIPGTGDKSASKEIDDIIAKSADWRGKTLARLRALVKAADPSILEEVKWKKPSKPEGVPVWSHDGIVCIGEMLKNAVRLTFPKGAQMKDPRPLFNTRLDSNSVRAIDIHQDEPVMEAALKALILEAVRMNKSQPSKR